MLARGGLPRVSMGGSRLPRINGEKKENETDSHYVLSQLAHLTARRSAENP